MAPNLTQFAGSANRFTSFESDDSESDDTEKMLQSDSDEAFDNFQTEYMHARDRRDFEQRQALRREILAGKYDRTSVERRAGCFVKLALEVNQTVN